MPGHDATASWKSWYHYPAMNVFRVFPKFPKDHFEKKRPIFQNISYFVKNEMFISAIKTLLLTHNTANTYIFTRWTSIWAYGIYIIKSMKLGVSSVSRESLCCWSFVHFKRMIIALVKKKNTTIIRTTSNQGNALNEYCATASHQRAIIPWGFSCPLCCLLRKLNCHEQDFHGNSETSLFWQPSTR